MQKCYICISNDQPVIISLTVPCFSKPSIMKIAIPDSIIPHATIADMTTPKNGNFDVMYRMLECKSINSFGYEIGHDTAPKK